METGRAGNQTHSEKLAFKSMLHSVYSSLNIFFFSLNTYSQAQRPSTRPNYFLSFSLLTTGIPFAILQPWPGREPLVPHSFKGHAGCWASILPASRGPQSLAQAASPVPSPRAAVWSEVWGQQYFFQPQAICSLHWLIALNKQPINMAPAVAPWAPVGRTDSSANKLC